MMLDKKVETYRLLVDKIYERCQRIQTENERCVMRINAVKKLLRQRARDIELLKRRLDSYQDGWRTVPMVAAYPKRKIEQKRGPKPKNKLLDDNVANDNAIKEKKVRKQRTKKHSQPVETQQSSISLSEKIVEQVPKQTNEVAIELPSQLQQGEQQIQQDNNVT